MAASNRNDLVLDDVQPDNPGPLLIVKMTSYCVLHFPFQFIQRFRLRENRVAKSARLVAAFGRFLNGENDLRLAHVNQIILHGNLNLADEKHRDFANTDIQTRRRDTGAE
ncbi:MAG TPA: hypothetical protein VN745_10160 [Verrucomicrobiae bacterium]|nr:hypothetical protein [Verrucomicrobiae bacterium]